MNLDKYDDNITRLELSEKRLSAIENILLTDWFTIFN